MVKRSAFVVLIAALAAFAPHSAAAQGRGRAPIRFAEMDRNNDRTITRAEWTGSDRSFTVHDWNADGILRGEEVRVGAERPRTTGDSAFDSQEREYHLRFENLDLNRDNRISRNEWHGTAERFTVLDLDRNGRLTREEFDGVASQAATSAAFKAGQARGLVEGRQAGREDKQNTGAWDLEGQRELEQADSGYDASVGPRAEYQAGYREAFRRGYREGFGQR